MKGETAVETYDHDVYRRVAKERGEVSTLFGFERGHCVYGLGLIGFRKFV